MHLSDHDLRQCDNAYLETLTPAQAWALLGKALANLKAARERLGQTPSNRSRPLSTRLPWEGNGGQQAPAGEADVPAVSGDVADAADTIGGADEPAAAAPPGLAAHAHRRTARSTPGDPGAQPYPASAGGRRAAPPADVLCGVLPGVDGRVGVAGAQRPR